MYDIITFGSATKDIFLKTHKSKILKDQDFMTGKGVCFNLGSKIDVDEIVFGSGGGGTNTAVAFAKQGFKVAYCGVVGDDLAGKEIIQELKSYKIDTKLIIESKNKATNHSVVLMTSGDDRTILVYRGASESLKKTDISWKKLKAKWFYIAPLAGDSDDVFEAIIDYAKKNNVRVALNMGDRQLGLPKSILEKYLSIVDVVIVNQEEAAKLTKIPYEKTEEIFNKLDEMCTGITIMTKGDGGVIMSDGYFIYRAPILKSEVVDKTGAGDSFASGFLSGFIQSAGDTEYALQLGTANASECLGTIGAKTGLLKKGQKFAKVEVKKEACKTCDCCS